MVSIDDAYQKKLDMLDAHFSQLYEWLPWHDDQLDDVPKELSPRKQSLMSRKPLVIKNATAEWRQPLEKRYGRQARKIQFAEALEITEYGHQPSEEEIRRLFPFFPYVVLRP